MIETGAVRDEEKAAERHAARLRDEALCVTVSVPWKEVISPEELLDAVRSPERNPRWSAHLARFFGEVPLTMMLGFFDRHGLAPREVEHSYLWCRERYACRNPELEAWLEPLLR